MKRNINPETLSEQAKLIYAALTDEIIFAAMVRVEDVVEMRETLLTDAITKEAARYYNREIPRDVDASELTPGQRAAEVVKQSFHANRDAVKEIANQLVDAGC